MPKYWLDSDVLIQCKNEHFAFDIAPGFWERLAHAAKLGLIASPMRVYDELVNGKDDLSTWARDVKQHKFFVEGAKEVQLLVRQIVDFVEANYSNSERKAEFVKGADPWVIAHAKKEDAIVVTREVLVGPDSTWVKIPNICKDFGVEYSSPFDMMRDIGLKLVQHEKD